MTSRSLKRGSSFSMPTSETSTSGSVVHIRPLPSDSTTTTCPVSAIAKFAPLTPTGTDRNFSRRYARAAAVRAPGPPHPVEVAVERAKRAALGLPRRLAQRLPVGDLADHPSELGAHR